VRHAVAERRGLDAEPGDRAAERDGLELGHDVRDQAVRQGGVDQAFVGGHTADVGGACRHVDVDDVGEGADVEGLAARRLTEAEQVGGRLGEPDGRTRWVRPQLCSKAVHGVVVGDPCR
jgi:hypothetical protein